MPLILLLPMLIALLAAFGFGVALGTRWQSKKFAISLSMLEASLGVHRDEVSGGQHRVTRITARE